jgi:hypothetical protein
VFVDSVVAENLWEDSVYEATVEAANQFGWSNKSKIFYISTSRRGKDNLYFVLSYSLKKDH